MVLCRFYQQGTCRYGDHCKFEHQINRGDHNYAGATSILLQSYANKPQQLQPQSGAPIDTNTLVKSVVTDMMSAEKGGQWLLSSYSPFKEKAPFPGFEDYCMEEIRLMYYEATKNGTVEQYKHNLQVMLQQAVIKIKSLQNPSPEAVEILKQIYDSAITPQSTTTFGGSQLAASSPFGATSQQSIFGGGNSVFGGQPQASSSSAPFTAGFGQSTPGNSIFGSAPQQPPSASVFSGANQQNSSMFATAPQQQNSIFGAAPQQQPPAFQQQSIFGGGQTTSQPSVFGGGQQPAAFAPQQLIFGGPQQPAATATGPQQQSVFGGVQQQVGTVTSPQQQSVFGGAQQPAAAAGATLQQPVFGGVGQQTSIFGAQPQSGQFSQQQAGGFTAQQMNIFQQNSKGGFDSTGNPANSNQQAYQHSSSIFGAPPQVGGAVFGGSNPGVAPNQEFYSKIEELSEVDVKWFQCDDLDVDNIPEKPPAYEMCFRG